MKVAVALSGGVDSTVAASLLQEAGHELVGVTMTLGRADEDANLAVTRSVAGRLGIPLTVYDLASEWRTGVLDDIRRVYASGATPNPCVRCNERVKFGLLPRYAFERLGCDRFATGHYARLNTAAEGGFRRAPLLLRAVDRTKDQSYFLYRVDPAILARTLFPLGEMTKAEVRAYAASRGLAVAERGDSQDFCGGDPLAIFGATDRAGEIVTTSGEVIGEHRGYWHYTVGMRKGLGIGGGTPFYVVRIDAASNRVVVAPREATFVHALQLVETVGRIDFSLPVKVRSAGEPRLLADGIPGVAPGQSAVFYDGEAIVGGGIIAC